MHVHTQSSTDPRIPAARARSRTVPRPVFFVRIPIAVALPEREQLVAYLRRWIVRELCGWLQLRVDELLTDGHVEWTVDTSFTSAPTIAVRCADRLGPRRAGLWAALSVAHALAELLGGVVVDPRRGGLEPSASAGEVRLRPPADGRVHAVHHLCVPSSRGRWRERWLSSVGMAHFGLPDLELVGVPEPTVELGARLLLGTAQHLIDAAWLPPSRGERPREILLTVGELHWALGGAAGTVPITKGRGWTRMALGFDDARAWPELLRLGPPLGARSWRDTGAWIRDAWVDLFGPPPAGEQCLRALG